MDPAGKKVILLGAGGAARAIATELLLAGAAEVRVVNRNAERGQEMVDDLAAKTGKPIRFTPWRATHAVDEDTDILVNATSIGLYPDVDAMPSVSLDAAPAHCVVCDAVFNPPKTALLRAAAEKGLRTVDGLTMLVNQGVIGYEAWTGEKPDERAMRSALESVFGV